MCSPHIWQFHEDLLIVSCGTLNSVELRNCPESELSDDSGIATCTAIESACCALRLCPTELPIFAAQAHGDPMPEPNEAKFTCLGVNSTNVAELKAPSEVESV